MNLPVVEMERPKAREAFLEYRRALRSERRKQVGELERRLEAEDQALMQGYKHLSQGRQLLVLEDAVREGGLDHVGLPKIAVVRADAETCYVRAHRDGAYRFRSNREPGWSRPRRTYPEEIEIGSGTLPNLNRDGDRNPYARLGNTTVPLVPPTLRPKAHLRNYYILWEVDEWQVGPRLPRPPRDPALLKHLSGGLYAVLAVWDLTPLERAVLGNRP